MITPALTPGPSPEGRGEASKAALGRNLFATKIMKLYTLDQTPPYTSALAWEKEDKQNSAGLKSISRLTISLTAHD